MRTIFMRARVSVLAIIFLMLVTGCDKATSLLTAEKYKNLQRFVGKGPNELLADFQIGPAITGLVPSELNSCMDDVFNYAQDIERLASGAIRASANGSHADSQRVGYISVEPSGRIDVILWCDFNREYYFWYSTAPIEKNASPDLIAWARLVGSNNSPTLRRFGEDHIRNFNYASIQKGDLASVLTDEDKKELAKEAAAQAQRAQGNYIRAGGVICSNPYSFFRVNAVERSGNPYAQFPSDCETVGADLPVNFIRSVNGLFMVGNAGGTAYVRQQDYR
jgi:hypothetical protein